MCAVQVFGKSAVVRTRNTKLSYYKDQLKLVCQVNIVLVGLSCQVLLVPQWLLLNSYLVVHQYDKLLFVQLNKKLSLMPKQLHLKMFLIAYFLPFTAKLCQMIPKLYDLAKLIIAL